MPRYYCDYCDTYLTHDSPSVRKQHNAGYKHKANVRTYYQQYEAQQNQYLIDQKVKEHLGQAAAFQQVGGAYSQLRPRLPVLPNPLMPMNPALYPGMRPVAPLPRPVPGTAGYPGMPPTLAPPGSPSVPGQVNPSMPAQINLSMPGQVNPSMPGQVNPSMPGQFNPSMPGQVNPSMPGQVNPSMPGQVNPSASGQVNPSASGQVNPSAPGQVNNGMLRPIMLNAPMMAPVSSGTPTSGGPPPLFTQNMYQANPTAPSTGGFESPNAGAQPQEAKH
ncbi:U1 small nuclear ribonucleoprotein C-like [Rutidosis leptorrhynchoides]|uniref:U1 small nuclear ribonucleoprotein C-like n=1 Tax=Rutidosis leptorrhynchoides TaxID=125765 RepID=UPI003A993493